MLSGATDILMPMFIKAASLEGLQSLMMQTNKYYKKSFKYEWSYTNKKDGYAALYYLDLGDLKLLAEKKINSNPSNE